MKHCLNFHMLKLFLSCSVFYVNVCCSTTNIFSNLFQELKYHISGIFFSFSIELQLLKIGEKFQKVGANFYYKQRLYYRQNPLISQIGGCSLFPLDIHFFAYLRQRKILTSPKNILDIYKYYISHTSVTKIIFDIEHLTDSYCIPSKTSANKTSAA